MKEFWKPNTNKIILFSVLVVMAFIAGLIYDHIPENTFIFFIAIISEWPFLIFGNFVLNPYFPGWDTRVFFWGTIISTIVTLVYLYFLASLIIWLFRKIKK